MKIIKIKKFLKSTTTLDQEKGTEIHDLIIKNIEKGIVLDFKDIHTTTEAFWNYSLGVLYNELSVKTIQKNIHIVNLSTINNPILQKIIRKTKKLSKQTSRQTKI